MRRTGGIGYTRMRATAEGGGAMPEPERREPVWPVASALIGAVVGAGFASGREIYQFFTVYGRPGLWGTLLAGLLLGLLATILLERGRKRRAAHYRDLFPLGAGWGGPLVDATLAFGLWAGLGVVLAGGGELAGFSGRASLEGILVMGASVLLVLWRGEQLFLRVNALLVPFFFLAVGGLWLGTLRHPLPNVSPAPREGFGWGALLFVSYNSLLSLGVLAPLGRRFRSLKGTAAAGMGAGAALGLLALASAAVNHMLAGRVAAESLPSLFAARRLSPTFGGLYGASLWAAMLTTGLGNGFALAARLRRGAKRPGPGALVAILAAAPLGLLGLVPLVERLYPLLGWLSLVALSWILWPRRRRGGPATGATADRRR